MFMTGDKLMKQQKLNASKGFICHKKKRFSNTMTKKSSNNITFFRSKESTKNMPKVKSNLWMVPKAQNKSTIPSTMKRVRKSNNSSNQNFKKWVKINASKSGYLKKYEKKSRKRR